MKRIIQVGHTSKGIDMALLLARVGIALLMLTHGLPKMDMLFSGGPVQFPAVFGLTPFTSLSLAVFAEVFCSLLLLFGLLTRLAVVPLIITMLVAVFSIHINDPFIKQEPGVQYLLVYLVLLFAGSGRYSLDYYLQAVERSTQFDQLKVEDPTLSMYR